MDAAAWRIRELVVEACGLVCALAGGTSDPTRMAELEHVRSRLLVLAEETDDHEAVDAACGVIGDIDDTLDRLDALPCRRGAA